MGVKRSGVLGATLAFLVALFCRAPTVCQTPPSRSEADSLHELQALREENETLRSLLPTSTSISRVAIADLSKEVATLREKLLALEQERANRGLESDQLRSERDRLRADIAQLYSDYIALRHSLLAIRSTLAIMPVGIDVNQLRAQLSATLDAIDLKAHLTLDGNHSIQSDPLILRLEGTLKAAEKLVAETGKALPQDYSFRVLNPDNKDWAELFSAKLVAIEIVKGKATGKSWQYVELWGEYTPTLPPVDGLEIEHKENSGKWRQEWKIFPRKTGSYVLSFGIAGSASRALTQPLEVKSGGWRLPFRFLWWLATNYLFWLGGILMVVIGHADKILTFLKNWREARKATAAAASSTSEA